jgi:type VI secretion system protein ImpL
VILNIGGQTIRYQGLSKNSAHFVWPGPDGDFVTLKIDNAGNSIQPTLTKTGAWAWLRFLNTAQISTTVDPKVFEAVFTLEGLSLTYQLTADSPVNPYIPGLLTDFRCPPNL